LVQPHGDQWDLLEAAHRRALAGPARVVADLRSTAGPDIPDLEYCSAFGDTPAEALTAVTEAKEAWLAAA
jgi:hypothetical protein